MQHNLQNCTLCDPSKYHNMMSFTTQIYHGFKTLKPSKSESHSYKKWGLYHLFINAPQAFNLKFQVFLKRLPWDIGVCNGLKVRPMVNFSKLKWIPKETFVYKFSKPCFLYLVKMLEHWRVQWQLQEIMHNYNVIHKRRQQVALGQAWA